VDRQVDELVVVSKGLTGGEQVVRDVSPSLANGSSIAIRGAEGKGKGAKGGTEGKGGKQEVLSEKAPAQELKP
jgi:hypothetical protein